jgi:peptidoglycan/LPS O-acetylase OafA/YrhL
MQYRSDIDGLRGVSVIAVVLFHAGAAPFFGGFVGVDVFFVISGFLITSLITEEIAQGRFSLLVFYERRIRRIFPALFAVLAFCSIAAFFLYLPKEFRKFAASLVATALFVSNIHFSREQGYFDAPPDTKPLLHSWSLAIEEQFYIVFPLVLILTCWWAGRRWVGVIFALFILSLITSIWLTASDPNLAFYSAPARAWELMLGALLASGVLPEIKSRVREVAALGGAMLIAWAVFRFSSNTLFPGATALVPCLGAALLIYAGQNGSSVVARALSWRPLVFVGLISYSLYLWHWPMLVFARYWNIEKLSAPQITAVIAASFVVAALSWTFVEQPFRRKTAPVPRKPLFAAAAVAMIAVVGYGQIGIKSRGLPTRFSPEVARLGDTAEDKDCLDHAPAEGCMLGAPVRASYAVWGDSHAWALLPAIGPLAAHYGKAVRAFLYPNCPPVIGFSLTSSSKKRNCIPKNNETAQRLESSPDIHTVILIARYALYIEGPSEADGIKVNSSFEADSSSKPLEERRSQFEGQLDATVDRLTAAGKNVVLVYPVPEIGFNVTTAAGRLLATGRDPARLSVSAAAFHQREDMIFAMLDRIGGSGKILRVYPHRRLCDQVKCIVVANGLPLYLDDDHLSVAGADYVRPELEPIFAEEGLPTTPLVAAH